MPLQNNIITWNTGRQYSKAGQRIAAKWDGNTLYYADLDRMCNGQIECSNVNSEWDIKKKVISAYDNGIGKRHLDSSDIRNELEAYAEEHAPTL